MTYKNAKRVLPDGLLTMVQSYLPEGGKLYVPPQSANKISEVRSKVEDLSSAGLTTSEIAKRVGRTMRRVNQIKKELDSKRR